VYDPRMQKESYYLQCLKENLDKKQRLNPQYSLRAFARDIDLHPSTLSAVFRGKRSLPFKDARLVAKKLILTPKEETLFLESLFQVKTKLDQISVPESDERFMLDESHYKVIAEWEHFAVLVLFDTVGFKATNEEIAKRLGVTESRAEIVLNHLLTCGLIQQDTKGNLIKAHPRVRTTEDIKSQAIHQGHRDALELGIKKLDEIEVDLRDFSEMALAIDPERITEAKTIIREFRQKMAALLRDGEKTEVFQLAIQFYPLTKLKTKSKQGVRK
jgi:uncharacterized protein (TIGR02147 family)